MTKTIDIEIEEIVSKVVTVEIEEDWDEEEIKERFRDDELNIVNERYNFTTYEEISFVKDTNGNKKMIVERGEL